jgi:hypothetical protein
MRVQDSVSKGLPLSFRAQKVPLRKVSRLHEMEMVDATGLEPGAEILESLGRSV